MVTMTVVMMAMRRLNCVDSLPRFGLFFVLLISCDLLSFGALPVCRLCYIYYPTVLRKSKYFSEIIFSEVTYSALK